MKLKYDSVTGEIENMGCDSEGAIDVDFQIPSEPLWYFTFNGTSLVRKDQSVIDAALVLQNFDATRAIGREAQVFSGADLMRLAPVSYTINTLITYKNFVGGVANGTPYAGLKQLLQGLVAAGVILQSDEDKLSGILAEQGVIL